MRKFLLAAAAVALLAGCTNGTLNTTSVTVGPAGTAAVTVPSAVAGLATFTDNDLKGAMAELAATNGGKPPTALPLADDYQCVAWLDTELPQIVQAASGILPSTTPKGAVSAFVSAQIALANGQAAVSNFSSTLTVNFAHNCGAAFAQDAQFMVNALAAVGVKVALPATGGLSALIPTL